MTKVIAVVSEKGGSGKTTVAVNLAVAAEAHGQVTAIFDLDPRANSAVWGDLRQGKPPAVTPAQAPRLQVLLDQARRQEADLVILDTPGNAMGIAEAACAVADLILIPCRPAPPDLLSIVPTVKVALSSGRPAYVLLNAAPVQGPEIAEARAAIERAGVAVCPVILYQRKAFMSRFHEGLSALEADPQGKAATETRELFLWACDAAGLLLRQQDSKLSKRQASGG